MVCSLRCRCSLIMKNYLHSLYKYKFLSLKNSFFPSTIPEQNKLDWLLSLYLPKFLHAFNFAIHKTSNSAFRWHNHKNIEYLKRLYDSPSHLYVLKPFYDCYCEVETTFLTDSINLFTTRAIFWYCYDWFKEGKFS